MWYSIGEYSLQHPELGDNSSSDYLTWIQTYSLVDQSWQAQYVASIFWVFTTMTTIGFGDIVPQNAVERLVAISIMILSVFMFAYTVNSIGSLLSSINEREFTHL